MLDPPSRPSPSGLERLIEAYISKWYANYVDEYYKEIFSQFEDDLKSIMSGPKNLIEAPSSARSTESTISSPEKLVETHSSTRTIYHTAPTSEKPSKHPPKGLTDLPEELLQGIFKNLTRMEFFYNGHVYGGYEYSNIEDWLAISLTSKQFCRIGLPMNTLSQYILARAVYHIQLKACGKHWSCSTCALPAWEALLLRKYLPAPEALLAGEGESVRETA
jgi:hypothetical protein